MVVKRRVYVTPDGLKIKVDEKLGLPENKWLSMVLELACALGVSSEFPNSHKLFQRWTSLQLTEKTLANQVEHTGNQLQTSEFTSSPELETLALGEPTTREKTNPDLLYVGVDGVMTPLNQKQGYKEAKVGVIFWGKDHQKINGQRGIIRQREYVATLKSRKEFTNRVCQLYNQVVGQNSTKTVVIGDGAPWIWSMAQEQFPGSMEILDFFHLSEYVWAVALICLSQSRTTKRLGENSTRLPQKISMANCSRNLSSIPRKKERFN